MTPKPADCIEAGKTLDADERLKAVHQLLLSVDQDADADQDEIDAAWDEVIDRRVGEIVSGKAKLVDGCGAGPHSCRVGRSPRVTLVWREHDEAHEEVRDAVHCYEDRREGLG